MKDNQIDESYAMFLEQHEGRMTGIAPYIVQWIYYNGYRDAMKAVITDLHARKETL